MASNDILFWLGLVALALTANAIFLIRRLGLLVVPSFFAGWLVSEAPLHHAAALAAIMLWLGFGADPASRTGVLGLGLGILSLMGLLFLHFQGQKAEGVMEDALSGSLGGDYRQRLRRITDQVDTPLPRGRLLLPLWLVDSSVSVTRDVSYVDDGNHRLGLRTAIRAYRARCPSTAYTIFSIAPVTSTRGCGAFWNTSFCRGL